MAQCEHLVRGFCVKYEAPDSQLSGEASSARGQRARGARLQDVEAQQLCVPDVSSRGKTAAPESVAAAAFLLLLHCLHFPAVSHQQNTSIHLCLQVSHRCEEERCEFILLLLLFFIL